MRTIDPRATRFPLALFLFVSLFAAHTFAQPAPEQTRWAEHARSVTITRDDWGIAHIKGKTDADTVFGMVYAQAEDDFNRIEVNYLNSLGRMAEAEGENAVWTDLRQRLFIDHEELKADFARSPDWLKKLMVAWADGLNYYLSKHPNVKPRVLMRFEPWMALSFTEGSIGGDIETIDTNRLKAFYTNGDSVAAAFPDPLAEPKGSNGIAIAPSNTINKKALLLINPHTSFYFRSELQITSDEGLNAYGAVTWGQFFIYQGFNDRVGWMHTSSAVDAIDHFNEIIIKKGDKAFYKHGSDERPVIAKKVVLKVKTATGLQDRTITTYRTHHGPVIASAEGGKWQSIGLMHKPVEALMQSYGRTKAKNYDEFKKVMELQANSSNATLFADADGNIAYFHPNFVPRRDTKFDWTRPVDGSDPASDWKGILTFNELPHLKNPATGWVYNSNDWPWAAAGKASLRQADFPAYVDSGVESARGRHAVMVLDNKKDFTLESLQKAAYDSYLPWFEKTLPALLKAYDSLPTSDARKSKLAEPIAALRNWDRRWGVGSVPTAVAVFWAEDIVRKSAGEARRSGTHLETYIGEKVSGDVLVNSLAAAVDRLTADFGSWNTPWGEINRFQRISPEILHPHSDAAPSIPVGFTSGNWGSLASFGARPFRGSKRWYGTSGNSFVATVEFGTRVRAKAVTAGGLSGDPKSKHFNDQAERYATGNLREVYFYPDQLKGHTERTYKP
jgi:acyl-homoserine-lactone acylase